MSKKEEVFVSQEELAQQEEYTKKVKELVSLKLTNPKAEIRTFGCQQNVADSQRIKGMLQKMGFSFTEDTEDSDLILFNTCAVRENAEDRVFGNVGALKSLKKRNKNAIIGLCGCMMQQEHIVEKIKKSFPFVDMVFGTHVLHKLPQMIYEILTLKRRLFDIPEMDGVIAEGIPFVNDGGVRGWLPIMYGCNNFCTYCIVPYVRGRERSRKPEDIIADLKQMVANGIKDITLLGQNVNSYDGGISFAQLLRMCNEVPGDFIIRFMTSHPKDCTVELLETVANCEKLEKHIHLPVQSGSDTVLKAMNRHYNKEQYLSLINKAKELMPQVMFTSDIIIGFPGETYEDAKQTIELIKNVRYQSLFTFIYSKRSGTPAASFNDVATKEEKGTWFRELLKEQEIISEEISKEQIGKTFRVLVEENARTECYLFARTSNNFIVEFKGDPSLIGEFINIKVTEATTWVLKGEKI